MNRAVVARATWGLAQELLESVPGAVERGVVVGGDARRMSRELSEDMAAILAGAGSAGPAVPRAGADAPRRLHGQAPRRGGGRGHHREPQPARVQRLQGVLGERGADRPSGRRAHRRRHRAAPSARVVVRPALQDAARARGSSPTRPPIPSGATSTRWPRSPFTPARATAGSRIVYTPLHGVGDALRPPRARGRADSRTSTSVPEQQKPDGAFPTVAFPNPEEPGAMDLALRARQKASARTSSWPTIRTPTASPWRSADGRRATASSRATRSACCWGTTC